MSKRVLTQEERNEFQEMFNLVDEDHGGSISKDELSKLMDTLHIQMSDADLDEMMREVDTKGTGEIEFEDFETVMSRRVQADYTPEQLRSAFKMFESEGMSSGYVSTEALMNALTSAGTEKLSPAEAAELLTTVDPDKTGKICYADFLSMMDA
eukprot:NODE_7951_length_732_cov_31.213465_g7699_i0.p1 GENE.NODE_7951_length_732_cov_31.213465_g7699_i0~~NODE_7951_length_732_cov_31.213465_g7699_i0.p1  ORF type:complete len:153 (-),score=26.62 NODE_7951_length_732_cov_31.213465_g7699_i0:214-672(-)